MPQIDPDFYERRHLFLGKASFIIGLIGLILFIVGIVLAFVFPIATIFLIYPANILITLGLLLGAISYFGPYKVTFGLIGFIISLVSMCIIPVLTVLISYGMYSYMGGLM